MYMLFGRVTSSGRLPSLPQSEMLHLQHLLGGLGDLIQGVVVRGHTSVVLVLKAYDYWVADSTLRSTAEATWAFK